MKDYFRCSLFILYVQQYSLRAYSPEVIVVDPEEYYTASRRDRPRSIIQTQHIQERRTARPRMATLTAPPPRDTAEIPSRSIPTRHKPARNHPPATPSNSPQSNRNNCTATNDGNRHPTD